MYYVIHSTELNSVKPDNIDKVVEAKAQSNSTTCSSDGLHTTTTTTLCLIKVTWAGFEYIKPAGVSAVTRSSADAMISFSREQREIEILTTLANQPITATSR